MVKKMSHFGSFSGALLLVSANLLLLLQTTFVDLEWSLRKQISFVCCVLVASQSHGFSFGSEWMVSYTNGIKMYKEKGSKFKQIARKSIQFLLIVVDQSLHPHHPDTCRNPISNSIPCQIYISNTWQLTTHTQTVDNVFRTNCFLWLFFASLVCFRCDEVNKFFTITQVNKWLWKRYFEWKTHQCNIQWWYLLNLKSIWFQEGEDLWLVWWLLLEWEENRKERKEKRKKKRKEKEKIFNCWFDLKCLNWWH